MYSNFLLAQQNFIERYKPLKNKADKLGIELYLENNVYSATNNERYGSPAPAMLLNNLDYAELKNQIDFNLLLDVAHLKVSCKTLNKNFESELEALFSVSDYIHISDNDGLHDTNNALVENSELHNQLKDLNWQNKTVTLEIYESLDKVKDSLELTKKMINARAIKM